MVSFTKKYIYVAVDNERKFQLLQISLGMGSHVIKGYSSQEKQRFLSHMFLL